MKKLYIIFTCIFILLIFGSSNVFASSLGYKNVITDASTIEEDFEVLGMDISNYGPTKEIINKSYIISYAEGILNDNRIQSYIYLYLSYDTRNTLLENFTFTYKLNNKEYTHSGSVLNKIGDRLFKIKGFKYDYIKDVDIKIKLNEMYKIIQESNYAYKKILLPASNDFTVSMSHSLLADNKPFEMELAYNSVIVIDEIQLVRVNVQPELWETCSFASWWNTFFDLNSKELYLHFYNFNFPDNVEVDSIDYAKFEYDYVRYYMGGNQYTGKYDDPEIKSKEYKMKEYLPGTKKFETYNQSGELEFETFVLGNRITKGEFPDYVGFSDAEKAMFDYDASILLDSSVKKGGYSVLYGRGHEEWYELENVNFLELHYTNDGIQYKCQVISKDVGTAADPETPVDGDDPSEDKPEWWEELWEEFKKWFLDNLPESAFICIAVAVLLPVIIAFCPQVLGFILKVVIWIFKSIIKIFVWIVKMPFKLVGGLFKLFRGKK